MTRNRAERRHHMARLKKSAVVIAQQATEAKSIRCLLSYSLYVFLLDVWTSTLS